MEYTIGSINFGPAGGIDPYVLIPSGEIITTKNPEYRLYVKKSGIMILQQCQRKNTGELFWEDIPTIFEAPQIGQAYAT